MAEVNLEMGKSIYENVCSVLDKMEINYQKHEEDFVIAFAYKGQDMNHELLIKVDPKREIIHLMERLPFDIEPERATDIACAVCYVNDSVLVGSFTYNMSDRLLYEVIQIYTGSLIGEDTIHRMLMTLIYTVEDYDDKFMALNKGYISLEQFKPQK